MYSMNMVAYVISPVCIQSRPQAPPSHKDNGLAHQVKFLGLTRLVDQQCSTHPLNMRQKSFTAVRKLFRNN